jgi:hypothetical protein
VVSNRNNIEDLYGCVCRIVEINTPRNISLIGAIIYLQYKFPVEVLLSIKSQFTANVQNVLHLNQYTHGHERTLALFKCHRAVANGLTGVKKCVGEMS